EKVRNVEILPPSTYNRRIGDELERIVMKSLAKDVDDRYQNAIDLHDDLQAFMYTAGEFYSRKDLAAWMKRVWAKEIEEESAKLEQYRHMPVPPVAPMVQQPMPGVQTSPERVRRNSGPMAVVPPPPPVPVRNSGAHAIVPPPAPASAAPTNGAHAANGEGLAWDDEELATNIYDGAAPDMGDAIVDDKPDLSKLDLNPNGAPVPHHSVAQKLPTAPPANDGPSALGFKGEPEPTPAPRNGAAARRRNPFDYVLPDSAPVPVSAAPTETPALAPRRRTRPLALYVGGGVAAAALCVAAAGGVVYYNSRPGTLFIASDPATNVQILLDNKRQPVDGTPATLKLEPGSYVLTVQREGYVPWNEQVEVKPGDTTRRRISLEPLASGTGFTLVSEPAGAQALLDGRALEGVTPLKVQSVMPGKHKIEVKTAAGASWQQEVTIEAGKMLDVRATIGLAAKTPSAPDKVAAKTPEKTPDKSAPPAAAKTPPVVAAVAKTPDKPAASSPQVAPKVKEPDPAPGKAKAPDKSAAAPEPKKSKQPDLTLPDEEKPKKVASADKPAAEKAPVEKSSEKSSSSSSDGWLRLGSKPWTNILVDGKDTGLHTPQTHLKLAAGSHRITLTNPQFSIKETFSVEIKSGETETVIKDLRPQGADSD
ncbi:MAG: PEGA domain-containing protein, partial [Polyangia bacterium]